MDIAVVPKNQTAVLNEAAPLIVFCIAFVIALGGVWAVAYMICGYGHVSVASVDFWRAQARIQCK